MCCAVLITTCLVLQLWGDQGSEDRKLSAVSCTLPLVLCSTQYSAVRSVPMCYAVLITTCLVLQLWGDQGSEDRKLSAVRCTLPLVLCSTLYSVVRSTLQYVLFRCAVLCLLQLALFCSCEVIKDQKTGNSLQYAFIEFETVRHCWSPVLAFVSHC